MKKMNDILETFSSQINESANLGKGITITKPNEIIISGMGGSALVGRVMQNLDLTIPITVYSDYTIPPRNNALTFIISYSGNTEEAISSYKDATGQVITMSAGGRLEELSQGKPHIKLPTGFPPRMSLGYQLVAILNCLSENQIIPIQDFAKLANFIDENTNELKTKGEEISKQIGNLTPIIYSSNKLSSVAYKWKINFNENSKQHAFYNIYPEWNHNELNAYETNNTNYCAIILDSGNEHPRIKKRIDVTKQLLKIPIITINAKGYDDLSKIFYLILLGDWVSYYKAKELGIEPEPVKLIEELKSLLK